MGGLINPPPTPGQGFDITPPSQSDIAQAQATGARIAGWFDWFWVAFWEHLGTGFQLAMGLFVSMVDSLLATLMKAMAGGQGTGWQGTYTLLGATISDLLGVEVDPGTIQTSMTGGARAANVARFGQLFLSQLQSEVSAGATGELPATAAGAYAWLGYCMEFAIREGNIEFMTSLIPEEWRFADGLRGYGVNLANVLGLGRLTRQALTSFMKIMVSDPMQNYLNSQYTPTILPVNSLLRAWMRGGMDQSTRDKYLSWLGYKVEDIPQLVLDASTVMSEAAAIAMYRTGFWTYELLTEVLVSHGIPGNTITDFYNATIAQRCETHLNSTVAAYLQLYKNRWIEHDDLVTQLQTLGLTSNEINFALGEIAPYLEYRTRELSWSDLESAYLSGLIDLSYISDWQQRMGYLQNDAQVLQYLMLLKQKKETTAEEIAQWRLRIACLTAISKKQPPPPGFDAECNPT